MKNHQLGWWMFIRQDKYIRYKECTKVKNGEVVYAGLTTIHTKQISNNT